MLCALVVVAIAGRVFAKDKAIVTIEEPEGSF
jgi:hypothetical protein